MNNRFITVLLFSILTSIFCTSLFATEDNVSHTHITKKEQIDSHSQDSKHNSHHSVHLDGAHVSLFWIIPFIGILLSIAILPLIAPTLWHHNYGKISLMWGLLFFISFWIANGTSMAFFYLSEVYLGEFIPFIVLLLALYTVSGGIRLTGSLRGSPIVNTSILLIGTLLASWMGTTGAAMLLIRPLIKANSWRKYQVHTIVFFIFLVANIGGSLTPLGDPPLFLGFLKGVSFFWTTKHMLFPMIMTASILLVIYFVLDSIMIKKEKSIPNDDSTIKLGLEGKNNLFLLPVVIGAVILSGVWHSDITNSADTAISLFHTPMMTIGTLTQIIILLLVTYTSLLITPIRSSARTGNGFTWEPILEVAKLFATIFLTMVPAIAILKAGSHGALAPVINLVSSNGNPVNIMYFWCTGILSSFLDNAPTYVVFFNTAGGNAVQLMGELSQTLLAISAGAVFMGANTYIGNAPNFMVKSIAEENKIKMPSFFGFMGWSTLILIPIYIFVTFILF
jgi:Na+/H+ antiporter NhaD/arsenite permease-like protein